VATDSELRELCEQRRLHDALTRGLSQIGAEIMSFLAASLRDETETREGFSIFCAALWEALPTFRWECSFRTWSYVLARHAIGRVVRERGRAKALVALPPEIEEVAASVRSATPEYLRTNMRKKVAALRRDLEPEERELLILRINRELSWDEIARVELGPGEHDAAAIARAAAALRKRFERLRAKIKEKAGKT